MFDDLDKMTPDELRAKRAEHISKAQEIATKAGQSGSTNSVQDAEFTGHIETVKAIDVRLKGAATLADLQALAGPVEPVQDSPMFGHGPTVKGPGGTAGHFALGRPKSAEIARALTAKGHPGGTKDISPAAGTYLADISTDAEPKRLGVAPLGLVDVIPTVQRGAVSRYLRQTVRTGGADIVAPGAEKPTLVLKLVPITSELKVVAVLSEPLDKFVMEDTAAAASLVQAELLDAVRLRLEEMAVDAFDTTSGVQTQAFDTDLFTTIRKARLKAETAGYIPTHIALNPADWSDVELTRDGQDRFQLEPGGPPLELVEHTIWSMEVVTSLKVPAGTGFTFNQDGVAFGSDTQLGVEWDRSGELFTHNQVRARAETRAEVELYQPLSVVKVDLTA